MNFFRPVRKALAAPAVRRYAREDRVACPVRGEIQLEICFGCPDLVESQLSASEPWIRCRPEVDPGREFHPGLFLGF